MTRLDKWLFWIGVAVIAWADLGWPGNKQGAFALGVGLIAKGICLGARAMFVDLIFRRAE